MTLMNRKFIWYLKNWLLSTPRKHEKFWSLDTTFPIIFGGHWISAIPLIDYLESLTVTQGRLAGQPFKVLPWQRRFVRGAFAPGVQSAALSVARGNGKTALLSGIAAATLDGPLAVPRGETVIVASSFEQARIAFEHVIAFMGDKLDDKRRWKVWDTAQQARIEDRKTGARVRCIGSDPRRAHGLAPVLVLADEPSQWPKPPASAWFRRCARRRASNPIADSWRSVPGPLMPSIGFQRC